MHPSLVSYCKQHDVCSLRKADVRAAARSRYAIKRAETDPVEAALEIQAAYDAVDDGTATQEQRNLVNKTDDVRRAIERRRRQQTAVDRIYGKGWTYEGSDKLGLVADKAYQLPRSETGLRSEGDPILKRVIASAGKPKRRRKDSDELPANALRTGPSAAKSWRQMIPIVAHDETYFFFSVNCIDLWRHDKDPNKAKGEKWVFESEEHMIAWLHAKHADGELAFLPTFAIYTPDDRYPGKIPSVHFYYMLPDDGIKAEGHGTSGVWEGQKKQLSMLEQVQAKLNEQLEADPGGLANPYHGKHPCGPHNRYVRINTTHMPTIGEMFEGLDCGYSRREMARRQGCQRLAAIGLDPSKSNTFFTTTAFEARHAVRETYLDDRSVYETDAHAECAYDAAWKALQAHIKRLGRDLPANAAEVLENLLHGCIAWAIEDFAPDMINRSGYNPGAAAHLIKPTDDARTRMIIGQTVGAESRSRDSKRLVAKAEFDIEAEGGEITVSEVSRRTGLHRKTCARHMFEARVQAVAAQMLKIVRSTNHHTPTRPMVRFQGCVWGVQTTGSVQIKPSKPQQIVIEHAQHPDDVPIAWRPPDFEDWKHRKLLEYSQAVRSGRFTVSGIRGRTTGSNIIDFLSSDTVTRYAPSRDSGNTPSA